MICNLYEGDSLKLLCAHCSSVSLQVTVRFSKLHRKCHKCGKSTIIEIVREGDAWSIKTEPTSENPP